MTDERAIDVKATPAAASAVNTTPAETETPPIAKEQSGLSQEGKIELTLLKTLAHYGDAEKLRTDLAERAKTRADLLDETERVEALRIGKPTRCFVCHAGFIYQGPQGDSSGRFCGPRCRIAYDGGLRYRPASSRYTDSNGGNPEVIAAALGKPMQATHSGFVIKCLGCGKDFYSKGLAFCSLECGRKAKDRQQAEAVAAEIGHEVRKGRLCECCGGKIPRYTKSGRATQKGVRFCSPKCQQRSKRPSQAMVAKMQNECERVQKVPVPQQLLNGVSPAISHRDMPLSGPAALNALNLSK
jgi:hypothetical protein